MLHPDLLLKLSQSHHQDRLCEVETWRLARIARQERTEYAKHLLRRLVTAVRQRLDRQARAQPLQPELVKLER